MSILIKGIDLPEKNKGLYVHIFNGKAEIVHPLDACEVEHTNAEAIQIPKGHGRLIDADELKESIEDVDRPSGYTALVHIEYAPTILEAEESR